MSHTELQGEKGRGEGEREREAHGEENGEVHIATGRGEIRARLPEQRAL